MKKYIFTLLIGLLAITANAQKSEVAGFHVRYGINGFGYQFIRALDLDSIIVSKVDSDGVLQSDYCTQRIYTKDSIYTISLRNMDSIEVITLPVVTDITEGDSIDLGLSVKWASHNVGAKSPEEYGGLYGWADPDGTNTSYNDAEYPNEVPPSDISGTAYDIAHVQWGESWRIPTHAEQEELVKSCKWLACIYKGVPGLRATGPNGNSIFFTPSGLREGDGKGSLNTNGTYWSSTLATLPWPYTLSFQLYFLTTGSPIASFPFQRHYGCAVRPVR